MTSDRNLTKAEGPRSPVATPESDSQVITAPVPRVRTPKLFKVLILNDDYTPMDFVVHVLQKFFKKSSEEAQKIMLSVHHQGSGVAGVYSFEIAETKVFLVNEYAKRHQYPLKSTLEETD